MKHYSRMLMIRQAMTKCNRMEQPYLLTDREEYDYCINRGFEPLVDTRNFRMDIRLRIEIQRELFGHCVFGRGENIGAANERFFRWVWEHKPHQCEECLRPLHEYSSVYCSHILTRGAFPEMAHDPRNINILCFKHHDQWEHKDRERMRIHERNKNTIELLIKDYRHEERYCKE